MNDGLVLVSRSKYKSSCPSLGMDGTRNVTSHKAYLPSLFALIPCHLVYQRTRMGCIHLVYGCTRPLSCLFPASSLLLVLVFVPSHLLSCLRPDLALPVNFHPSPTNDLLVSCSHRVHKLVQPSLSSYKSPRSKHSSNIHCIQRSGRQNGPFFRRGCRRQ